jgi:uncharacterized membrane protein YjfL (UPF0719 family)
MEKITATSNGLSVEAFVSTILYTTLGISIMLIALVLVNLIFRLNMRHELVEENNTAYGIMIAGITISVALIIAGTILS